MIGNRRGEAGALTILGLTYSKMGRAKEASTHLMGALDIYTTMGDWKSKALTQIHLAALEAERNQIQMALRLLQDSYDYFVGQAMPAKAIDVQKMIAEVGREGS